MAQEEPHFGLLSPGLPSHLLQLAEVVKKGSHNEELPVQTVAAREGEDRLHDAEGVFQPPPGIAVVNLLRPRGLQNPGLVELGALSEEG